MKILHIDSSITGARSVSRELSGRIVEQLGGKERHEIVYRDVAAEDMPHFTAATAPSAHPLSKAAGVLDATQQAKRDESDAMLREFMESATVVIGVPMYNFSLPSGLKAWLDRIIVPGVTFRPGPDGSEGLAGGKRVILAIARGAAYGQESAYHAAEHAEALLRSAFGFIGVTTVEAIVAEGLNRSESRENALASARAAVQLIAA